MRRTLDTYEATLQDSRKLARWGGTPERRAAAARMADRLERLIADLRVDLDRMEERDG